MAGTILDNLFLKIGLEMEEAKWLKADNLIEVVQGRIKKMAIDAALATTDVNKAMSTIGFPGAPGMKGKPEDATKKSSSAIVGHIKRIAVAYIGLQSIRTLSGWIMQTTELGGKLNDLSVATGIGTDALQKYGHAAKLNGSDLDSLVDGASKLNLIIGKTAATGKGPAVASLKKLGLTAAGVNKVIKGQGLEAGFELVADKLAAMPDGAEKSRIAFDLLGKSGRNLIPTINNLRDGMRDAEELGLVIDAEDVKNLDDFGDEVDRAKGALGGLKNQMVAALLPALKDLTTGALDWLKNNRELVRSGMQGFVKALSAGLKLLGKAAAGLAVIFKFIGENWDIVEDLGEAIATVIRGLAVMFARLVLLVMAVGRAIAGAASAIANGFSSAWSGLKAAGERIKDFFVDDIPNAISSAFAALWERVKQGASDAASWLRNAPVIKQLLDLGGSVQDVVTGAAVTPAASALDAVRSNQEATRNFDKSGPNGAQIRGGDVKFEIHSATGDPKAIADEVDKRMRENMDTMLQQTADAL